MTPEQKFGVILFIAWVAFLYALKHRLNGPMVILGVIAIIAAANMARFQ